MYVNQILLIATSEGAKTSIGWCQNFHWHFLEGAKTSIGIFRKVPKLPLTLVRKWPKLKLAIILKWPKLPLALISGLDTRVTRHKSDLAQE